jgi:hypothetical protein
MAVAVVIRSSKQRQWWAVRRASKHQQTLTQTIIPINVPAVRHFLVNDKGSDSACTFHLLTPASYRKYAAAIPTAAVTAPEIVA